MIRFLKQFWRRFVGYRSEPDLSVAVGPQELATRFLFSREHFAETKGIVKSKAFLPDVRGETSVFRVNDMSHDAIWAIGNSIRGESAKARGDLLASVVQKTGLTIRSAPEDHPRHAVIVDWPTQKHEQLMAATLLSKETMLQVQIIGISAAGQ
jgi:hypothetical protein